MISVLRMKLACPVCRWEWDVQSTPAVLGHFAVRHICDRDKCRRHWVIVYRASLTAGSVSVEARGITYDPGPSLFAEALRRIQLSVGKTDSPILDDEITLMLAIAEAQVVSAPPPTVPDASGRLYAPVFSRQPLPREGVR